MFDVAPTELMLVAAVALVVIGPKDLPQAMRVVGRWVGKAQATARHFRAGLDEMVRQAELDEMEKRWAEENARIMREHPFAEDPPLTTPAPEMLPLAAPAAVEPFPADPVPTAASDDAEVPPQNGVGADAGVDRADPDAIPPAARP